ncbi:tRNA A37 threonylcarbamoyladenosine biosynthesis protein TsaE [Methanophagales archaeon]|nr:tRNA A37 threonylcarbamoyladenosine biosynthesis protein TsaE [Methanophagales archaeon]
MWYERFGWRENVLTTRPSPNLIGLERERQELKESVESGRILLISGEIGTGKTSLLLWLRNTLKKTNIFATTFLCKRKFNQRNVFSFSKKKI